MERKVLVVVDLLDTSGITSQCVHFSHHYSHRVNDLIDRESGCLLVGSVVEVASMTLVTKSVVRSLSCGQIDSVGNFPLHELACREVH